jgi:uncharacterized membrane protein (UPF0136 family)
MNLGPTVLLVYGILMLLGGLMGARAGSRVSLIAGVVSGLLLVGAWWLSRTQPTAGLWAGTFITFALCASFAMRLYKTGRFMPSGALLTVSVVALLLLAYSAATARRG